MTNERMKDLLINCVNSIAYDNDMTKEQLLEIIGFTPKELKELGFDWYEEETDMKIKYFVYAIGYDKNDCVTDYEEDIGEFDTVEEARERYALVCGNPVAYLYKFDDMGYWMVQLEKCEVTEEYIECADIVEEVNIYEEDLQ